METVAKWFDDEAKLFEKNRALIDKAFAKANAENALILSEIHKLA